MEIRFTSAVNTLQVPAIRFHFEESKNGTEALCCQYSSIHLCASVYLSKNITVHSVLSNTLRGILPVNSNQNSPLYFRLKRKEPLCRTLAEGWKKGGYIHLYKQMQCAIWSFNICNIRLGCSGYCYYAISHHPELAIQYRGFTINADQSIETNFFSSASFLVLKPLFCDFFLVPVQSVQRYCIRHVPLGSFFALQLMHLPPLLLRTIFP